MSLIKNIGVGKEAYYNPFTISADDVQAWYDEVLERGILPKEMDGIPCEWELSRYSSRYKIFLRVDWASRYVSIDVYINSKCFVVSSIDIGEELSNYMLQHNPKIEVTTNFLTTCISYEPYK